MGGKVERTPVSIEDLGRFQVEFCCTVTERDVDDMGVIYYGGYSRIFDKTRYALCQAYGYIDVNSLYDEGWMIPVIQFSLKILRGARVGDQLKCRGWWHWVKGVRIRFAGEIYDAKTGALMSYGYTEHCFVNPRTFKPLRPDANWKLFLNFRKDENSPIAMAANELVCTADGKIAPGTSGKVPKPVT